jgi:hypothetical protein
MALDGIHERGIYLTELRRLVTGMCKETADDLTGARIAWRGQSPRKFRPIQLQKDPEFAAPVTPPVEETVKKPVVTAELKGEKPPVTFMEQRNKEEKRKTDAALVAPVVKNPKVKMQPSVITAPASPKQKKKSRLDEKPAKTATKVIRGKK